MWDQAVYSDNTSCCTLESLVVETWLQKPQNTKKCLSTAGLGSQKCAQHGQRRNAQGEISSSSVSLHCFWSPGKSKSPSGYLFDEGRVKNQVELERKFQLHWRDTGKQTNKQKGTNLAAQRHLGLSLHMGLKWSCTSPNRAGANLKWGPGELGCLHRRAPTAKTAKTSLWARLPQGFKFTEH